MPYSSYEQPSHSGAAKGENMSSMVKCDECGKLMYTDSREEKGVYVIDPLYGFMRFHLCRQCYAKKFPQMVSPEEKKNERE